MDRSTYEASCAICGSRAEIECHCENDRLSVAIDQAEQKWLASWTNKTRDWVANNATKHILATFAAMKEARLASHAAYVRSLPYYNYYEEFNGNPPLHPQIVSTLSLQIAEADFELRRNLDADWRACVIRYPDVLTHYYSVVKVTLPHDPLPPAGSYGVAAPRGSIAPPPSRASYASTPASAAAKKKERRTSGGGKIDEEPGSGKQSGRDSGDNVLGNAIAKLFGDRAAAAAGAAGAAGSSGKENKGVAGSTASMGKRSSLAGRGTVMPEAARHRRRSGSEYVLSGFPRAPVIPASDWHALSARFL